MTNNTQRSVDEIADEIAFRSCEGEFEEAITRTVNASLIRQALLSERQEADKLRQENEVLKAQVAALNNLAKELLFREWAVVHIGTRYRKAEITVTDKQLEEWRMVLSTLPSTFLEIQKAKELLLSLCEAFIKKGHHIDGCVRRYQPYPLRKTDDKKDICDCRRTFILSNFEALRTLQQAQEKP